MTEQTQNKCRSLLPLFDKWWTEHSHELPETHRQSIQEFWDKYEPYMDADEDENNPSVRYVLEFNFWFYVWIAHAVTISSIVDKAMLSDNGISYSDLYLFISIFRVSREALRIGNEDILKMFYDEIKNISLEKLLEDFDVNEDKISYNPFSLSDFFDSLIDIDEDNIITIINHIDISVEKKKALSVSVREKNRESFFAIISQESLIQRPAFILSLWRTIPNMTNRLNLILQASKEENVDDGNYNYADIQKIAFQSQLSNQQYAPKKYESYFSIDFYNPFSWTQEDANRLLKIIRCTKPTLLWFHYAFGEYSTNDDARHAIDEYIHSIPKLESLFNLICNDEIDIKDYEGERIDQLDLFKNKFLNV